ncbi:hypothetical protein IWX90DRAFT_446232 [Phyllosticta citrichinensis]|uniref:Secreted protein n=1 Tax=Phyllosticta citrichinensis TaxID=1130410 RepID=A0ABR1XFA3_9PEZI
MSPCSALLCSALTSSSNLLPAFAATGPTRPVNHDPRRHPRHHSSLITHHELFSPTAKRQSARDCLLDALSWSSSIVPRTAITGASAKRAGGGGSHDGPPSSQTIQRRSPASRA